MKRSYAVVTSAFIIIFASFFFVGAAHADRGMMMLSARPDIELSEGAQKAVIAFNGTDEVLILATEAAATMEGKVLEFLPLPSQPVIEEGSAEVFERVMYLIDRNAPTLSKKDGDRAGGGKLSGELPGITVVSKTTIGPHDITVVKIESAEHFKTWVTDFFAREGITSAPASINETAALVTAYLDRGMPYFVFDVVTVKAEATGIAPLVYRFATDSLYYPLEISSRTPGDTEIDLFIVAPGTPKKGALPKGFSIPDYVFTKDIFGEHTDTPSAPVSFALSINDRVALSPSIAKLLPGFNTGVNLTAVRYRGPLSVLSGDLVLTKKDFSDADFDGVTKASLDGRIPVDYAPPGMINLITSPPEGFAPSATAEGTNTVYLNKGGFYSTKRMDFSASYCASAAIDGDVSTPFILQNDKSWFVDLGRETEIDTVDLMAAVPIPDKGTTYTYGIRLFASDTGKFTGEEEMAGSGVIESFTQADATDDPSRHASLIRLTNKHLRTRYLKIEYVPYGAYNDMYLFEVMIWQKAM